MNIRPFTPVTPPRINFGMGAIAVPGAHETLPRDIHEELNSGHDITRVGQPQYHDDDTVFATGDDVGKEDTPDFRSYLKSK